MKSFVTLVRCWFSMLGPQADGQLTQPCSRVAACIRPILVLHMDRPRAKRILEYLSSSFLPDSHSAPNVVQHQTTELKSEMCPDFPTAAVRALVGVRVEDHVGDLGTRNEDGPRGEVHAPWHRQSALFLPLG